MNREKMMDCTYDPDNPLDMGPDARGKYHRWAGVQRPVIVDFEHRHGRMCVPQDLVEHLDGIWNPLREELQDAWDERAEGGGWGAVAVARWKDGGFVDFMEDPVELDHTCLRNTYRSNREVTKEFFKDKARVHRTPEGATVIEPTWIVKGGSILYDPTHTRTMRGLAELLDPSVAGLISDDHFNEVDHEVTEHLVEEHISAELEGSVLAENEQVLEKVRDLVFGQVAHWCPECHEINRSAAEALNMLGAKKCYGCDNWFAPHDGGGWNTKFLCKSCIDGGADLEVSRDLRIETIVRTLAPATLEQERMARLAATLTTPGHLDPEFGEHERGRQAEYLYGMVLGILAPARV